MPDKVDGALVRINEIELSHHGDSVHELTLRLRMVDLESMLAMQRIINVSRENGGMLFLSNEQGFKLKDWQLPWIPSADPNADNSVPESAIPTGPEAGTW